MIFLRLVYYYNKEDQFKYSTVFGDIESIYNIYHKLIHLTTVWKIEVFDSSGFKLDMNKRIVHNYGICEYLYK